MGVLGDIYKKNGLLNVLCSNCSLVLPLLFFKASVPVDVMPGQYDPTNYTLPQQPLHPCMFPLSSAYNTLQLVSNPFEASIDGVRYAASSFTRFLSSSVLMRQVKRLA